MVAETEEEDGEVRGRWEVQACPDILAEALRINGREGMKVDRSMKSVGVDERETRVGG